MKLSNEPVSLSSPALFLIGMIAGIVICNGPGGVTGMGLAAMVLAVLSMAIHVRHRRQRGPLPAFAGLVAVCSSLMWQPGASVSFPDARLGGRTVGLEARLLDRQDRDDSVRLLLDRGRVPEAGWQTGGLIQVTIYRQPVTALPGDRVAFPVRLHAPRGFGNPGGFDYGAYLRQRGIVASGYGGKLPVHPLESPVETDPLALWQWNRWRQHISDWIVQTLPVSSRGLAEALLVGKRGRLDLETREILQVTGTMHLLAISGLHVGLVAFGFFGLFRLLLVLLVPMAESRDMKRLAALLNLPVVFAYAALAGWSVSTQRAAVMVGLFMLAMVSGRPRASWRAMCWAAIVLLLVRPAELFTAGFQLSFMAALALLTLGDRWQSRSEKPHKYWLIPLVPLVAAVATGPLVLHYFHFFHLYGPLANLLAVFLVSLVIVPLGMAALLFSILMPGGGVFPLLMMGEGLELLMVWLGWLAQLPGAWMRLPGPVFSGLALAATFLTLAWLVGPGRWRWVLRLLVIPALFWPRPQPPEGTVEVTVLDVGQAQSVVVRDAGGHWSVVDAGGPLTPRFNVGEGVISAFLWHHGVTGLKRLVISHPQKDHMAGAERLLRNFSVESLWLGHFPRMERMRESYRRLLWRAERRVVRPFDLTYVKV